MTEQRAHKVARSMSIKRGEFVFYVVREPQEDGTMFDWCDEFEATTHYCGAELVAAYSNGEIEQ